MLIKRTENNGIIKALYESSNIVASTYSPSTKRLTVIFKKGDEYIYEGVPDKEYAVFELADSQGRIFNKNLRQYKFTRGGNVDIEQLRKEIEDVKAEEIKQLNRNIVEMAQAVYDNSQGVVVDEISLERLIKLYNLRKEKLS
jgi:thymidylate synthase